MRPAIGYPSFNGSATFTGTGFVAAYPVTNLASARLPTQVARANSGASKVVVDFVSPVPLSLISLVNHTLQIDALAQITTKIGGVNGTVVQNFQVSIWPSGAPARRLLPTRPFEMSGALVDHLEVAINSAVAWEAGYLDIGTKWEWLGISPGRKFGLAARGSAVSRVGGSSAAARGWLPRQYAGQIDYVALAQSTTVNLDFQRDLDLGLPFVFVQDMDDTSSWARTAFLCRNRSIPALVGALRRHDAFSFDFIEYRR